MKRIIFILVILSSVVFANNTYSKEQLEKMIAKMVILGFYGTDIKPTDKIYQDIKKYDLGGVILFDKDPTNKNKYKNVINPTQLQLLTSKLQSIRAEKLLIAIDQEGGVVQRLKKSKGFEDTPKASNVALRGELFAKKVYANMAKDLNKNGLNLNFAPVVDLKLNPKNSVIVKIGRSFGKEPSEVIKYSSIFVDEMKKQNVISVLKHFPGHGSSLKDSHKGFVDITKTWKEIELEPYMHFIKQNKVDMIMTAHVYHKDLDFKYPATLSENVNTNILREMLGFKGVLVSDDLQMGAISKHYTLEDTLTLAINSGVDMLLIANQLAKTIELEMIINIIHKQVKNGNIPISRIVESNNRINKMLNKY